MSIWGFNTCNNMQLYSGYNPFSYPACGMLSSPKINFMTSIFNLFTPFYDVFDSNIFGYTPDYQFGFNPMDYAVGYRPNGLIGFSGNAGGTGVFNFLYANSNSETLRYNQNPYTTTELFSPNGSSGFLQTANPYQSSGDNPFGFLHQNKLNSANSNYGTYCFAVKSPVVNNALNLALSQYKLGVSEDLGKNDSKEIRMYKNGQKNSDPWCASFVSWCFGSGQNSTNKKTFGYTASSQEIKRKAEKAGFYSKKSSYTPCVGDLMIISTSNGDKEPVKGHVGIVIAVNSDGSFETIEGNYSNKVSKVHRTMNEKDLDGFVRMDEWMNA
mgnify:CR=1 FL=1